MKNEVAVAGELTEQEMQYCWNAWRDDGLFYVRSCLSIAPKDKAGNLIGVVPFRMRPIQKRAWVVADRLTHLAGYERVLNLKARQMGFTTMWEARAYWKHYTATGPRQTDLIADKEERMLVMREIWDRFYEELPMQFKRSLHGQTKGQKLATPGHRFRDSRAHVRYHSALARGSRALQGSASSTIIGTEVPYWEYGADVILSALNALGKVPGTIGVLEGTANGAQGEFYDRWLDAVDHVQELCQRFGAVDEHDLLFNRSGWGNKPDRFGTVHPEGFWDGSWYPLFFAWWENEEYTVSPAIEGVTEKNLTKDEEQLRELYPFLTLGQLAWRRATVRDECGKNMLKFKQEYPSSPEEAFLFSGHQVFDMDVVNHYVQYTRKLEKSYYRDKDNRVLAYVKRIELGWDQSEYPKHEPRYDEFGRCSNTSTLRTSFKMDRSGRFYLRWWPQPGWIYRYVIGADVAEGLAQGDYSVAMVYDRHLHRIPMMFRARVTEEEFGVVLAQMSLMYGDAGVLVETNFQGKHVTSVLSNICPNALLSGRRWEQGQWIQDHRKGWMTTGANKVSMIGQIQQFHSHYPANMPFYEAWFECVSFTREESGKDKMGAEGKRLNPRSKNYDDCVMAWGLALQAHYLCAPPQELKPRTILTEQERENENDYLVKMPGELVLET